MSGFVVGYNFLLPVGNRKEAEEFMVEAGEERFTIEPYGNRFWALYDHHALVCVTVYKKGAAEVKRRLEDL